MNVASSGNFARLNTNTAPLRRASGAETGGVKKAHADCAFPIRERFTNPEAAAKFLDKVYIPGLTDIKTEVEAKEGREARDQDIPTELIRMVPPHPKHPPLLIVGGMGPLAGAQAFQDALKKFGDTRECCSSFAMCRTARALFSRVHELRRDSSRAGTGGTAPPSRHQLHSLPRKRARVCA